MTNDKVLNTRNTTIIIIHNVYYPKKKKKITQKTA